MNTGRSLCVVLAAIALTLGACAAPGADVSMEKGLADEIAKHLAAGKKIDDRVEWTSPEGP